MVYTKLAKQKGVKFMEGVQVQKILTKNGAVNSVETSAGTINCEYFVNCGGLWSREIGKRSVPKVRVPLHANEHFYIVTKEIEGMDKMMPVIRDFDGRIYLREWGGEILLDPILHRMPVMEKAEIRTLLNGPESFTPDANWILGESAEGKGNYRTLEEEGAVFGETNAYERPVWFTSSSSDHEEVVKTQGSFRKPAWFESVKEEYWACKERVCIIDMSSFSKLEIKSHGDEALNFLQYMCSNDIDQDIFSIIHTGMQNETGGYENDCTIVPMHRNHFFMISPTSQQTRSFSWLRKHLPQDGSVTIRDVTSAYSGINVIGPHAYQLLSDLTDRSMTLNDFKPMTCDVIDVGYASGIRAMRLTHAGEDGFVLYIPSEYTLHVYDMLMKAGKDYGISNAGYYALRMLRIEKFFAFWGQDLTTDTTPLECGREFRVKFDKGDFIGREALLKEKEEGINQRFVQFFLNDFDVDADVWPWGGEPVYRNGKFAGIVSSSGYGFTLDRMICLGFVRDYGENDERITHKNMHEFILDKNAKYEIAIAGRMFPAEVRLFTPKRAYTSSQPVFIPVPSKDHQRT
ncbi:hypothetical protein KUTeg_019877 [Tegillarca granosa]|uniref:Pyruvate dehydrogenase phosphatase regulatory subunit, mitochondrial n=1 Tax=Tegillarca granosa TaxID=220873 RepID=A0ABQ9EGD8_TEGGR|nr:hypothetical protein KUTeg_019877 [Tegillarca granosa]